MNPTLTIARAAELSSLANCTLITYGYEQIFTLPTLNETGHLVFPTERFLVELLHYWTQRGRRFRRVRVERLAAILSNAALKHDVTLDDVLTLAHEHQLTWVIDVVDEWTRARWLPSSATDSAADHADRRSSH